MYKANIRPRIIPITNNARRNFRQGVGLRATSQSKHRRQDRRRNPNAQFPKHLIPFKLPSPATYPSLKTLAIYNTLTPGADLPPADYRGRSPREDLPIAFKGTDPVHRIAATCYEERSSFRQDRLAHPRHREHQLRQTRNGHPIVSKRPCRKTELHPLPAIRPLNKERVCLAATKTGFFA
jgi:hypothetical protein